MNITTEATPALAYHRTKYVIVSLEKDAAESIMTTNIASSGRRLLKKPEQAISSIKNLASYFQNTVERLAHKQDATLKVGTSYDFVFHPYEVSASVVSPGYPDGISVQEYVNTNEFKTLKAIESFGRMKRYQKAFALKNKMSLADIHFDYDTSQEFWALLVAEIQTVPKPCIFCHTMKERGPQGKANVCPNVDCVSHPLCISVSSDRIRLTTIDDSSSWSYLVEIETRTGNYVDQEYNLIKEFHISHSSRSRCSIEETRLLSQALELACVLIEGPLQKYIGADAYEDVNFNMDFA